MNIAYIASSRIPSERAYGYAIAKLCEEWGNAEHEVSLIMPDKKYGPQQDVCSYYNLSRTFSVHKLPASDFIGRKSTASKIPYVLDLLSYATALHALPYNNETVLYTREYLLALVLPKRNLFLEMHTVPSRGFLLKRALKRVRGIVAISGGVRDELVKLGVPSEKILVAHDGVDLERFSSVTSDRNVWKEFGVPPEGKIVLYTGHFYEWKGADTAAEAGRMMPQDVHTVLVGGVDRELEDFKKKYVAPNVHIVPYQPPEKIPQLLKGADVLVLPNSAKAEISRVHASPLKLFEYMASGVPVVASDVPSLKEILPDDSSYFFRADDAQDLARVIADVFEHGTEARGKASRALELVQTYTWQERARHIAEFMETKNGSIAGKSR